MGLIYMRTSPSGKYYIGRTAQKEEKRWKGHIQEANSTPYNGSWLLNKAINKYGGENFTVRILEDNIPTSKIQEREQYWIDYYDATNPEKGYNRGNSSGYLPKPVSQYSLTGEKIKDWDCVGDILNFYDWNERNLYDCLSGGYSHFNGFLWKYTEDERPIEYFVQRYNYKHSRLGGGTPIKCVETNEIFSSIRALERELNVNHGVISRRFRKYGNKIEYNNLHYIKETNND